MKPAVESIAAAGSQPNRLPWWAFALAIALLMGLELFFCTGVVASDDTFYLDIACGNGRPSTVQMYARLAMWYPIRVGTWLVADSWRALMWPPFISAGLALLAVAVAGRRWFGDRAALLAVVALGLTTHFLISATIALPDIVAAAAVAGALALAGPTLLDRQHRRWIVPAILGGLVIGVGYSAKETTALVIPSLGMFVLLRRTGCPWAWQRLAAVALGAGFWLVIEAGILWHSTGDPLYHYAAARDSQAGYGAPLVNPSLAELLDHWTQYVRWLLDPGYSFRWWGPIYLAAMTFCLWKSNDRTRLLLCVILCLGAYLSAGSSDLGRYVPLWQQPRYLVPLLPPAALLVGYAADWLLRRQGLLAWATAAAVVCLAAASLHWANQDAGRWYSAREFKAGQILLGSSDSPPDWSDRLCASEHTACRIYPLIEGAGLGSVHRIYQPPRTPDQWIERFGGRYLAVSGPDRRPAPLDHRTAVLSWESVAATRGFEVVASATPPSSRAREVFSWLGVLAPNGDPADRIEVVRIPEPTTVARHE